MTNVQLTLTGEGLNVEKNISLLQAGQIISFLGSNISPTDPSNSTRSTEVLSGNSLLKKPVISPSELISKYNAKTNPQKILVLADYLCNINENETFTSEELKSLFGRLSGGKMPKNFTRDLKDANAYVFDMSGNGQLQITDTGKDILTSGGFGSLLRTITKRKSAKRSSGDTKKKTVSDQIASLEINPSSLAGFPGYFNLNTKGQKILWILAYADSKNIRELSPADIEFLTDRLKERITTKAFSALNEGNYKKGYDETRGTKYVITQSGLDYLKSISVNETDGNK